MRIEIYITEIAVPNLQGSEELADWNTFEFIRDVLARNIHLRLGFMKQNGTNGICQLYNNIETRWRREDENHILQVLVLAENIQ